MEEQDEEEQEDRKKGEVFLAFYMATAFIGVRAHSLISERKQYFRRQGIGL